MKKMLLILFMLSCGIFNVVFAQTATITFTEQSFNWTRQYGGANLQQVGQYTFTALPSGPDPCIGHGLLTPAEIEAYQDEANSCCCVTGTCIDDGCGKFILYAFYPDPMNPNCNQPVWYEPVNLPIATGTP